MSDGCSTDTPPVDDLCADPAYRAAHPQECAAFTLLILTPDQGLIQVGGTIEYTVMLRANGQEVELTQGLTWDSSNVGAAVINDDGVATGVSGGQTSISVAWQNLTAQAQLDVVANCAETNQNFRILIDNSKSMGQSFSGTFATKLAFSKSIARDFCDTINFEKDQVAASSFNDDYEELETWSTEATAPKAAIAGIAVSTGKTNLADALSSAVDGFEDEDGVRVIVLFTDGQWTGDDPKPVAQAFRESGGFLVIVATRAFNDSGSATEGKWFSDLFTMASGGFLLSAYEATEDDILQSLSGLKSFICSGGCSPPAGTAPTSQLNYTGWSKWSASRIIREADGTFIEEILPNDPRNPLDDDGRPAAFPDYCGNGLWDVRPGNGGYADLQGTGPGGYPPPGLNLGFGRLTSLEEPDWEDGKDYSVTLKQSGSSSRSSPFDDFRIRITCGDNEFEPDPITDATQDFEEVTFEWTQDGDFTGPIIIEQIHRTGHFNVGTLIDDVLVRNETDDEVILEDDFNNENLLVHEPDPGGYGYGCLQSPPGAQSADTQPPPFLEE